MGVTPVEHWQLNDTSAFSRLSLSPAVWMAWHMDIPGIALPHAGIALADCIVKGESLSKVCLAMHDMSWRCSHAAEDDTEWCQMPSNV